MVTTMPATATVPGAPPVMVSVTRLPAELVPVLTRMVLVPATEVAVTVATDAEPETSPR